MVLLCFSLVQHDHHDVVARERAHRVAGRRVGAEVAGDRNHSRSAFAHPTIDVLFHLVTLGLDALKNFDLLHVLTCGWQSRGWFGADVNDLDDRRCIGVHDLRQDDHFITFGQ